MAGTVALVGFKETPGDGSKVQNINETDNALWVYIKGGAAGGGAFEAAQVTKTNRSGTIASGGVAQDLMAANPNRQGWEFQNNSNHDLWINDRGDAAVTTQPSIRIAPGSMVNSGLVTTTTKISVIGGTTGQTFTATEW